jgi:repressor LexA
MSRRSKETSTSEASAVSARGIGAGTLYKRQRKLGRGVDTPSAERQYRADPDHGLTSYQGELFQVTSNFVEHRGHPSTLRRIDDRGQLTSSTKIPDQLAILRDAVCLSGTVRPTRPTVVRSLRHPATEQWEMDGPTDTSSLEVAYVPLVGRIAAGKPIFAEESIEDIFPLPRRLVGEGMLFLLEVAGDSMIDAGIEDDDWVVVRQQSVAENGEIVAAMIDGEATVKTFKRSNNHVWLLPHNPAHVPILGDTASILGKVVAILRRI